MERILSKKVTAEDDGVLFETIFFGRSLEKFNEGLRTTKNVCHFDVWCWARKLTSGTDFLISSYGGGDYTVVTTAEKQWAFLTEELKEINNVMHNEHEETATLALMQAKLPEPKKDSAEDGQHRHKSI
jgi:hypothetical protein